MKKFCFFLILLFISCGKNDEIPYEYVNIAINLDFPDYMPLNAIGNSLMVKGGVKGIIIYHKSKNEFVAYERTCPFDPKHKWGKVSIDKKINSVATDTVCGSKFSLILDGAVLQTPASLPLKMYFTSYNPNTNILYITN